MVNPMSTTGSRIHSLDGLRATAMLLGILIHGLNAYRTDFSFIWSVQDASRHVAADYLGHVIHAFRMPLFFILSGFLTHMVYHRVSWREFLARRFHRVVVPMLLGVFTLIPLNTLVGEFAQAHAGPPRLNLFDAKLWKDREAIAADPSRAAAAAPPADNPFDLVKNAPWPLPYLRYVSLGHLWFLYDLTVFFLIVPGLAGLIGRGLGEERLARFDGAFRRWVSGPAAALPLGLLTLPLLYVQSLTLYSWSVGTQLAIFLPFPFFLLGFVEVNMLGYYLAFFAFGWVMRRQPDLIGEQTRRAGWHLSSGLAALTISFVLQEKFLLETGHPHHALIRAVASLCYAVGAVSLCLGGIGWFSKHVAGESPRWRYVADASYWMYVAHLPLVVLLQLACAALPAPWFVKVAVVCVVATALLLASYEYGVRYTWIGRLLNGERARRS